MWIERATFAWRISSCWAISSVRRAVGSKRLSVAASALPLSFRPIAEAGQQLLQVGARFGVEAARNSSKSMFAAVCDTGSTSPLRSLPADGVPGLTSTVMSCSCVFGRSSIVALR